MHIYTVIYTNRSLWTAGLNYIVLIATEIISFIWEHGIYAYRDRFLSYVINSLG